MPFEAFIRIGELKGECADAEHRGEIDVVSYYWGATQVAPRAEQAQGGRSPARAHVQDFSFVKRTDASSPPLFTMCCSGERIRDAVFVVRLAERPRRDVLQYTFAEAFVSSIRPGGCAGGGDDVPLEEVSLGFSRCEVVYQPGAAPGEPAPAVVRGGWDLAKGAPA